MNHLTLATLRRHEAEPPRRWPQAASNARTTFCVALIAYIAVAILAVATVVYFAPASSVAEPCGGPGVCVWGP